MYTRVLLCPLVTVSTHHSVHSSLCPLVTVSTCHCVRWSLCPLVTLYTGHSVCWSLCPHSRESVLTLSRNEVLTVAVTVLCGVEWSGEVDRRTSSSVQVR